MAKKATRDAFGDALKKIAQKDRNVYAMDCDLGRSTRAYAITEVDPSRFIEMGISEQDMVSTAAGMASAGKTVFVNSFAVFLTGRAYDQIRQQIALPRSNVKICASSAGLTQGADGATHQSITDMNLMRGLPHMMVLSPADAEQTEQVVEYAHTYEGPVYIRLSRYSTEPLLPDGMRFEPNKIQRISDGNDIALVSTGPILEQVLIAAERLQELGYSCGVYNVPSIKPLDTQFLENIGGRYSLIATIEEHSVIGGLGSAVSEVLSGMSSHARLVRLGVKDCFGESGEASQLLEKHGLNAAGITESIVQQYRNRM